MITPETAARIWECYREIKVAESLLEKMEASAEHFSDDVRERTLKDHWGRQRNLQLGVPNGDNAHRLFDVAPRLAGSVIRAHIAEKRAELVQANEQARIELDTEPAKSPEAE